MHWPYPDFFQSTWEKMSEVYAENGKALLTLSRETGFDDIGEERARMIGRGYCENEDFRRQSENTPIRMRLTR